MVDKMQQALDATPFARECGMRAVAIDVEAGTCRIALPLTERLERMAGSGQFHGGAIAALIDTAGTFVLALTQQKPVPTINFRTDYLRPAVTTLTAEARIRKAGRTVGVVDIDVFDAEERLVALGRGTFGT